MRKLYLLYFAESGRMVGMYSGLRKVFGREPEPLLEITHDVMGDVRVSWQNAVDHLGVPVEHYFRDQIPEPLRDFLRAQGAILPVIVGLNEDGKNQVVCSRDDLFACGGKVEALEEKLKQLIKHEA
ncbi:MAG: hypothetical protein PHI63_06815 [Patescibacteria group bacterium]|nr:hypothetical protein [Patescibacteria group bacterium]